MDTETLRLAVKELPPIVPTETALTATTATSAIATGATAEGFWLTFECDVAFNILFGLAAVAAPTTAHYPYAPGSRRVYVNAATATHYRVRSVANGFFTSYRSSR